MTTVSPDALSTVSRYVFWLVVQRNDFQGMTVGGMAWSSSVSPRREAETAAGTSMYYIEIVSSHIHVAGSGRNRRYVEATGGVPCIRVVQYYSTEERRKQPSLYVRYEPYRTSNAYGGTEMGTELRGWN
jgi:hypothetical protein